MPAFVTGRHGRRQAPDSDAGRQCRSAISLPRSQTGDSMPAVVRVEYRPSKGVQKSRPGRQGRPEGERSALQPACGAGVRGEVLGRSGPRKRSRPTAVEPVNVSLRSRGSVSRASVQWSSVEAMKLIAPAGTPDSARTRANATPREGRDWKAAIRPGIRWRGRVRRLALQRREGSSTRLTSREKEVLALIAEGLS